MLSVDSDNSTDHVSLLDLSPVDADDSPASVGCSTPEKYGSPRRTRCCPPTPDRTPPPSEPWKRMHRTLSHPRTLRTMALGLTRALSPLGSCTPNKASSSRGDSPAFCSSHMRRPCAPSTPRLRTLQEEAAFSSPMRSLAYAEDLAFAEELRNPFSPMPCEGSDGPSFLSTAEHAEPLPAVLAYLAQIAAESPTEYPSPSGRLADDFDELVTIGDGCSSEVYKARSRINGLLYAVKVRKQPIKGLKDRENQLQEVYALSAGYHPHIIHYQHSWVDCERLYIVAEYCPGGSVSSEAWCDGVAQRPWSEADLLLLMRHVADALAFLHARNMAHMDLKMDNVYITSNESGQRVYKLGDLGLVRMITGDGGLFAGLNESEGDSRYVDSYLLNRSDRLREADVFSLGASVYELARGQPLPSQGDEWHAVRDGDPDFSAIAGLSAHFLFLLRSMLHPDPDQRPPALAVYQFTTQPLVASGQQLSQVEDLQKENALLRAELQTLRNLRVMESRTSSRRLSELAPDILLSTSTP
eukprot:EG_transcript_4169